MLSFVEDICKSPPPEINITQKILCHTISNNAVPYLRICHDKNFGSNKIVCIARQHPGETVGSYALEAFVRKILTN